MITAVKDGEIPEVQAAMQFVMHEVGHDAFALVHHVLATQDTNLVTLTQFRPQALVENMRIICDEVIRNTQDARRRAVILF